ncbi:MAG: putative esterase [Phenylobacterium sp.]|nr:putative esterase [Phenylobacterium sp.]
MRLKLIICALALAMAGSAAAAPGKWVASWAAPPTPPLPVAPARFATWASPVLNNQTVVQRLRLSAGGARLRLRFTNEYGSKPLAIGRARVALIGADGKVVAGSARDLAFSGAPSAVARAHAPLLSDPVALPTRPLAMLQVSLYFPTQTEPCGCHSQGGETAEISPPGDFVGAAFTPASTTENRVFLSGVEVERAAAGPVIVAFGDSITDGYLSTVGANRRWPDRLAERLAAAGSNAAVANTGIGGNRVLSDAVLPIFGQSALARFDRDVLGQSGATHLVVLEGVNDLGTPPPPSAEALIAGYRQLIARAHAHGLKVIMGTVLPYKGAPYFRPDGEAVRQAVNGWIRTAHEADGVIDFDAAVRDPADPARLRAAFQSGDWLHPNDAGYRAMGEAVDLKLFR